MSKRQILRRFELSHGAGPAPAWLGAVLVLACLAGLAVCGVVPWPATAARGEQPTAAQPAAAQSAAAPAAVTGNVVPDVAPRLAKWKRVDMPYDDSQLSERERQLVLRLVAACRQLESIYWRQSDAAGLALYKTLAGRSDPAGAPTVASALRRLLWINGSRWDLLDGDRPLVGSEAMPPGRGLYPLGLTRQQIEAYIAAHPAAKDGIYDEHTVIARQGDQLVAQPYHTVYHEFLAPAAQDLQDAAGFSDDPAFAKFLRLRAAALLSDDYYASDLAWLDMVNPKFDLIYAPYETYLDDLLGVKTSYGAAVLIRNDAESAKLSVFQKYVPDIQDALPLPPADRPSKRGHVAPMEVMDSPFRAGDLRHGYQAVADNLPNDPRVHELKGSKQIFFKNFMDLRVQDIILPLAQRVMRHDQAVKASADGYLAGVMMHEICHGLGPAYAHRDGKREDIRAAIGPTYSGLEEAKADATGMFGLAWLVAHGALPQARLEEYYTSYVAGIFRTVRFGTAEAHSRAEMMEFNFLAEKGAISRDAASGLYAIDYARIPGAFAALTLELLQIEATGDRARAEAWFEKYGTMPPELKATLSRAADLEVDIDPHQGFGEAQRID
jgi:hypothetical protein